MQKTKRLYFIDAVRAFAILMMLQGHFIDTALDPAYRDTDNIAYNIWLYFRGITAPVFFTISGLIFSYLLLRAHSQNNDKARIKKGFFRGLLLILTGYLLRVNFFSWLSGDFNTNFLKVDVLQCIGLSLILLIGLHLLLRKYSYLFSIVLFTIGFLCFLTEPLYRDLELNNIPLLLANYLSTTHGSVFTILPWFGYSAFGAFLATVFFRHADKHKFKFLTIIIFVVTGYLLMFHSSWFLNEVFHISGIEIFHLSAGYNYLFTRFGNVLVLFGLFYTLERYLKASFIAKIGQKTLSIYIFHFILLFGSFTGYGLKRYLTKVLNPQEAIAGAFLFIFFVCTIAFYYAKTNAFLYSRIKFLIEKMKSN
ncbi:heparan-alpha-glucosaminide N-acetyltransferase domain-containing protein [Seonamhaeicola sp. ML3]|uniref:heparan-alpha-glucosaminide N-acetyltransferase domain-containing protein n=1 Tax=Seonamhaeicola sp. ML3 TaxID=2937786 RepID=UPI00200D847C|nr:heparan-alpha-glucosaminide N-acetyltransferase domain-containing protein [Seonamhaeicola sp. ML3]